MRILTYNSSARGSGQFVRSLKLAQAISSSMVASECVVLTGNGVVPRRLPSRTAVRELPAIHKSLTGEYIVGSTVEPQRGVMRSAHISDVFAARQRLIRSTIEEFDPDVFLVDSRPGGLNGELVEILGELRRSTKCTTALLLRDIVDHPDQVIRRWSDEGTYDLIEHAYDRVLIFGCPEVFDAVKHYQLAYLAGKISFLGYLGNPSWRPQEGASGTSAHASSMVLVTVGGGFDGDHIIETVCEYLNTQGHVDPRQRFTVVLGNNSPLVVADLRRRYSRLTRVADLRRHVESLDTLISEAGLVVSMCGYNTLTEVIQQVKRVVAIPRTHSGREQLLRANLLARVYDGLWVLPEDELTAKGLGRLIRLALASPQPKVRLQMNGAPNLISFLNRETRRES